MQPGSKSKLLKLSRSPFEFLYRNGSQRVDFDDENEFAHHTLQQAEKHWEHTRGAFHEHERASNDHNRQQELRSYALNFPTFLRDLIDNVIGVNWTTVKETATETG